VGHTLADAGDYFPDVLPPFDAVFIATVFRTRFRSLQRFALMNLLTRYMGREIYASIALVFAALLMLFAFLDFIRELNSIGQGQYHLGYVLLFVLLTIPGHIYELFPVAVLIGTIFALVQMAAHSEMTVYRTSGASLWQMIGALFKIAFPLIVLSFVCGELIAPPSERMAQKLRLKAQNSQVSLKEFRSGVWVKDELSFVNVKGVMPDASLSDVDIYRFDDRYRLQDITHAKHADFVEQGLWQLEGVLETRFNKQGVSTRTLPRREWHSVINPRIFSVLLVVPEQMSAMELRQYASHLRDNRQKSARYEIAMWSKLAYPFAILVMMVLALPFAAYRRRSGGISGMIFAGIVLGLSFHFFNKLVGSLGALNDWQPFFSASVTSGIFLLLGVGTLWRVERH
jgi:lipopolysaccharide export system permease protein